MSSYKYLCWARFNNRNQIQPKSLVQLKARRNLSIAKEQPINVGSCDKIFSSTWIDNIHIICGTKCNKLLLINSEKQTCFELPLAYPKTVEIKTMRQETSSSNSSLISKGIHSMDVNESKTCFAVSGGHPEDVVFYLLPEMIAFGIGSAHKDWIYSLAWLYGNKLVTGGNDGSMHLWDASVCKNNFSKCIVSDQVPVIEPIAQLTPHSCHAEKIRALSFNSSTGEFAALRSGSITASLNIWKGEAEPFCSTSYNLSHCAENVCLKFIDEYNFYAVGFRSGVSMIDSRIHETGDYRMISSIDNEWGVRSIETNEYIMTIGTGQGNTYLFDMRASAYIVDSIKGNPISLKSTNVEGYIREDYNYQHFFGSDPNIRHAVYTQAYNPSKTKLFLAGGPLQMGLHGNFSSIWM